MTTMDTQTTRCDVGTYVPRVRLDENEVKEKYLLLAAGAS